VFNKCQLGFDKTTNLVTKDATLKRVRPTYAIQHRIMESNTYEVGVGPIDRGRRRYQDKDYKGALSAFTEVSLLIRLNKSRRTYT
jgi:hypothetical protein